MQHHSDMEVLQPLVVYQSLCAAFIQRRRQASRASSFYLCLEAVTCPPCRRLAKRGASPPCLSQMSTRCSSLITKAGTQPADQLKIPPHTWPSAGGHKPLCSTARHGSKQQQARYAAAALWREEFDAAQLPGLQTRRESIACSVLVV